jgi:hypothetical protein
LTQFIVHYTKIDFLVSRIAFFTDAGMYEEKTIPVAGKKESSGDPQKKNSEFSEFFIYLFKEIPLYINKQCRVFGSFHGYSH